MRHESTLHLHHAAVSRLKDTGVSPCLMSQRWEGSGSESENIVKVYVKSQMTSPFSSTSWSYSAP